MGCTIGSFVLWNWGASRLPAGRAGVFLNLEPVSGALLGVTLLGDTAGPAVLLGGAVVLVAALLVSMGTRPPAAPSKPARRVPGASSLIPRLVGMFRPPKSSACDRDSQRVLP